MALKAIRSHDILPVRGLYHSVFITDIIIQALSFEESIRIFPKAQHKVIIGDTAFQVISRYQVAVTLFRVPTPLWARGNIYRLWFCEPADDRRESRTSQYCHNKHKYFIHTLTDY